VWRLAQAGDEVQLIRSFRSVFGEAPHRHLQRRRVERSMFLLRETDRSATDAIEQFWRSRHVGGSLA